MPAAYPTAAELVTYFGASGFGVITTPQATELVTSAIAEFERLSQRIPFIAATATKYFDTEGRRSNDGYRVPLREFTVLAAGVAVVWVNESNDEETLLSTDFDFMPIGNGVDCKPFETIRLRYRFYGGKLKITGLFGYSTTIPQDVYDAVRDYCVVIWNRKLRAAASITAGGSELTKEKVGQVEFTYDRSTISSFETQFYLVAGRHELL